MSWILQQSMDTKSAMRKRNQSAENLKGKKRKQQREREHAEGKLARVPREEARLEHKKQTITAKGLIDCTFKACVGEQACRDNGTHKFCACTYDGSAAVPGKPCPRIISSNVEPECTAETCVGEQACRDNGTRKFCACTSDGSPAVPGKPCPRTVLPTGHANPIHGVRPPIRPSSASSSPIDKYTSSPPTEQLQIERALTSSFNSNVTTKNTLGASMNVNVGLSLLILAGFVALLIIVVPVVVWYLRRRSCTLNGKTKPRVRPGEPLLADRYITNPQYGVYGSGPPPPPADDTNEPQVPLLDRHALTFLEEVGEGCFGKVHKGLLRDSSGEHVVAIKVLKESANRSAEEDFVREVSIMSAFRHDNILTLVGVAYRNDLSASPWMVFEYMEHGDLAGVLRGSRGGGRAGPVLDEPALLRVAVQVARGMHYLAARRFVHRDLAARNCLVGSNLTVKIADFGMSRDVYTCDYYKMGGERPMPVRWMSPESIVYARFTHESDVWSYGVVLWEIYSRGKQPFYGHNNDGATRMILQGIVLVPPEECPRFACELMRACWQADPRDRITFDEICRKLEVAVGCEPESGPRALPRPPAPPLDSAGYLIPARPPPVDYLTLSLPEPEDADSEQSSDDAEDEEFS